MNNAGQSLEKSRQILELSTEDMNDRVEIMKQIYEEDEKPQVGMFWYKPNGNRLDPVYLEDYTDATSKPKNKPWTTKKLHTVYWKKLRLKGDYKYAPRGRVYYDPKTDKFEIAAGDWLNKYPQAKNVILAVFNLKNVSYEFVHGNHWDLGSGMEYAYDIENH
jgi:hypothetical protein